MRFFQFVIRRHFRPAPDISHYFYSESIRHYRNEKKSALSYLSRRLLGLLLGTGEKTGQ